MFITHTDVSLTKRHLLFVQEITIVHKQLTNFTQTAARKMGAGFHSTT